MGVFLELKGVALDAAHDIFFFYYKSMISRERKMRKDNINGTVFLNQKVSNMMQFLIPCPL